MVNWLAVELSSPRGSLALLREGGVVEVERWMETTRHARDAFGALRTLMTRAGISPADLDAVAVGRGPGNYTGMRIALALGEALALPGGIPVIAVPSGTALARQMMEATGATQAAVVGDARRGQCWLGIRSRAMTVPEGEEDWSLVFPGELAARIPADAVVASSEPARVEALLAAAGAARPEGWMAEPRYPDAADVARMALERWMDGRPSDPLVPLYLHPAVG